MRTLTAWPEWGKISFTKWPANYESWLNDHFPNRNFILYLRALLRNKYLLENTKNVLVSSNNWLFYSWQNTFRDFLGQDKLNTIELAKWELAIEGRSAWWSSKGVKYLLVIVPNKSTIYPENLPKFIQKAHESGKLDQILEFLKSNQSPVNILDLRTCLNSFKLQFPLYWSTDSHWSGNGLWIASETILNVLNQIGFKCQPRDESKYFYIENIKKEGDCVRLLTLHDKWPLKSETVLRLNYPKDLRLTYTHLTESNIWQAVDAYARPVAYTRESSNGCAVMLCDSFFRTGGQPLNTSSQTPLILNFHRFISLWNWVDAVNFADINMFKDIYNKEHPDVVIEQITERYLRTIPPDSYEFRNARDYSFKNKK